MARWPSGLRRWNQVTYLSSPKGHEFESRSCQIVLTPFLFALVTKWIESAKSSGSAGAPMFLDLKGGVRAEITL